MDARPLAAPAGNAIGRDVHFFSALRDTRANHPEELNTYSEKKASRFATPERRKHHQWLASHRRDFKSDIYAPSKSCR
ncbi:MAG: hypothetical protein J0H40_08785 [Rhizobiales bacterium]|nr:hypothetical protein [Hyphomicrobiales bacterium]